MDKFAYRRAVVAAVKRSARRRDLLDEFGSAFQNLTDQYVSIAEAEQLPRGTYFSTILTRAYAARRYYPQDPTFEDLMEMSSLGPDYSEAMKYMPDLLEEALSSLQM